MIDGENNTSFKRSNQMAFFCLYYYAYNSNDRIKYRKVPNISPGIIAIFKHIFGGLYSGGLIFGGFIFGGHFVLVSEYQDLKNHCFI